MKRKCKITKEWNGHAVDTVLEVDEKTFASILEDKAGVEYTDTKSEDFAAVQKSMITKATDAAVVAVEAKLKEMASDTSKMIHISVKDRSDDDPTFGYLPDNAKCQKDLSKNEVAFAFGRFAVDVQKAARGGRESEVLMKCRERSEKLVTKAAGDGMIVGGDESGGYLIFSAASAMIQAASLEASIVRPRANKVTMATQLLRIPYLRDTDHSTGTVYGGIKIYFDDENAEGTASKPKLEMLEFKLKKMTAMGYASEEWIKWSPVSLGSWLIPKFGEAVGFKEDLCFLGGPGGAQPLGIRNAPGKIQIAFETDQDATTFVLENSTNMFARLKFKKAGSVCWVMNQTVFPQLPLFNIQSGTGSSAVFTNSVLGAPGQSLWGYPIVWTEKVPALGTAGCVLLTDFSDYTIADDQSGPEIAQSIHLKFDLGQTAFRMTKYIDGQNESATAMTPAYGSTLSPVIEFKATA
ncbi:MAG: phage major capsid protein [Dehalococcoidia bacterium]|jgi:HK97 family phage major capsid protein